MTSMLTLHHGNRLETLADAMAERLAADPLAPMVTETVVVPHRSMGHWLSLRLADRHGIAANIDFPFLGAMVWQLFREYWPDLPQRSGFDREALRWRVLSVLPEVLAQRDFHEPARYLAAAGGSDARRRYQLADRLAGLFDQYLVYRPDWVLDWESTGAEHWQGALWRRLVGSGRTRPGHRARLLHDYIAALGDGRVAAHALPPRLQVFALGASPPAYLDLLAALARRLAVDIYVLNPSLHYWGDIMDERRQARIRRRRPEPDADEALHLEVGNPLLASMGQVGKAFLDLLHERGADDEEHFHDGDPDAGTGTVLSTLQADILHLRHRGREADTPALPLPDGDRSIVLHACHSPMREVQVLHDQLRRLFQHMPDLRPRDVVVMTPDIDAYAPFIEAVFANARDERHIPWSISDRTLPRLHPVVSLFLQLLDLPASRLTASEVLGFLDVPALRRRYRLDEHAVQRIRNWVRDSGIRWGVDAGHRDEAGLPATHEHTWRFGLERLLLGYAVAFDRDDPLPDCGILPQPGAEGAAAETLGQLLDLWQTLCRQRRALRDERDLDAWRGCLVELLETLLEPGDADEDAALQDIRDRLAAMAEAGAAAGLDGPVALEAVREHLSDALGGDARAGGYLTGQVTFCAMVPMRSVPFEVVCLLGMNDRDFPRQPPRETLDLMTAHPRRGDRRLREDDRYLFLEALLSARRRLMISYVGRGIRDDRERLPSTLVKELSEVLDESFQPVGEEPPSRHLRVQHPMQPFSQRYRADGREVFSHATEWLRAAGSDGAAEALPPFADAALAQASEAELAELTPDALAAFLANPAEAFLSLRLDARMPRETEPESDSEPFALDGLAHYQLGLELVTRALDGPATTDLPLRLRAAGRLPQGAFGDAILDQVQARAQALLQRLRALGCTGMPRDHARVALDIDGLQLAGRIDSISGNRRIDWRPARIGPADRLRLWISHLALAAVGTPVESHHAGSDATLTLPPIPADEAREQLRDLAALYHDGLRRPLALLPRSSYAFAAAKTDSAARNAAIGAWQGSRFSRAPPDSGNPAVAAAFRGRDPLAEPEFETLARRVYGPILAWGREAS